MTYTNGADQLISVTFPLAFPTQCLHVIVGNGSYTNGKVDDSSTRVYRGTESTTGFTLLQRFTGTSNGINNAAAVSYLAIGY